VAGVPAARACFSAGLTPPRRWKRSSRQSKAGEPAGLETSVASAVLLAEARKALDEDWFIELLWDHLGHQPRDCSLGRIHCFQRGRNLPGRMHLTTVRKGPIRGQRSRRRYEAGGRCSVTTGMWRPGFVQGWPGDDFHRDRKGSERGVCAVGVCRFVSHPGAFSSGGTFPAGTRRRATGKGKLVPGERCFTATPGTSLLGEVGPDAPIGAQNPGRSLGLVLSRGVDRNRWAGPRSARSARRRVHTYESFQGATRGHLAAGVYGTRRKKRIA